MTLGTHHELEQLGGGGLCQQSCCLLLLVVGWLSVLDPAGLGAQAKPQQEGVAPTSLTSGHASEGVLRGGEKQTYFFHAENGQFIHVEVEQIGIDVAVTVISPGQKKVAEMDTQNGSYGPEKVSLVADATGNFLLEVASSNEGVPPGRYHVTIDAPRLPTENDRRRIAAERLLLKGEELEGQHSGATSKKAIATYLASLPLWRAIGDSYEEAVTLDMAGFDYDDLGEKQKALESFAQALTLQRAISDREGEATSLNNIGLVYNSLGEKPRALDYYQQALPAFRAVGDISGTATTLNNVGSLYDDLGEKQKALDCYREALPLRREVHDRVGEAATLNNLGTVYHALGEMQRAQDFYQQSLPIWRELKHRSGEASTLNNIGRVYGDLGQAPKALDYYRQALPIRRAIGDKFGEGATSNNVGRVYESLDQEQKALAYYLRALPLERAVGDRFGEARTLSGVGHVYEQLGRKQQALQYYNRALPEHRAVGDRDGEAATLNDAGRVYYALRQKSRALQCFAQALALFRSVGDPLGQGRTLTQLMRLWRDSGDARDAIFFGKQAVNTYQQIRANIRKLERETQQSFLNAQRATYSDLADILITQGRLLEAQQVLELLKNEEYFNFIRRDEKSAASLTAPVPLTKEEEELSRSYNSTAATVTAVGNQWAALHAKASRTPDEDKRLKELSDQLKAANQAWSKFLDDLYLEIGKSKQPQTSVESLQETASGLQRVVRQLGPGTVALYTLVGEEKYHVILVTSTVELAREYPITAAELNKRVAAFRTALLNPKSDPVPSARALYKILVGPVEKEIAGAQAKTLMWSLDGVLRYVPMAALHDGHEYLVDQYRNIVFTPASIPTLASRPAAAQLHGLGMGVSKAYGGMSALPAVPAELHGIIHEAGASGQTGVVQGHMLIDDAFTEDNFKQSLGQKYPLIHIASHFVFGAGNDTDSFLLLGGKEAEGQKLTLAEINDDPDITFDDVELLTLSACNTALSLPSDGREVDGLGMLAQRKGARAVMASLWSVYDPSTSALMQNFYRTWTTGAPMPKSEALRLSQAEFLHGTAGYTHPYYWAPFILIGNSQ